MAELIKIKGKGKNSQTHRFIFFYSLGETDKSMDSWEGTIHNDPAASCSARK